MSRQVGIQEPVVAIREVLPVSARAERPEELAEEPLVHGGDPEVHGV